MMRCNPVKPLYARINHNGSQQSLLYSHVIYLIKPYSFLKTTKIKRRGMARMLSTIGVVLPRVVVVVNPQKEPCKYQLTISFSI